MIRSAHSEIRARACLCMLPPPLSQVLSSYCAHASAPALVQAEVIGRYIAGFDAFLTSMQVSKCQIVGGGEL